MPTNLNLVSSRRAFLTAAAVSAGGAIAPRLFGQSVPGTQPGTVVRELTVYKDANCGCCKEWVKHIQRAGFVATVHDTTDMDKVKRGFGVPAALDSCHTARIGKYTIEGHVPADLIVRLLREQPLAGGLAVPGMPFSAPGMDGAPKQAYDVLLFDAAGKTRVYASR